MTNGNSALVAMSGGVDSTVAAMLALRQGIDCEGAIMKLCPGDSGSEADAQAAARSLCIPLHVFDFSSCFAQRVLGRFVSAYNEGCTPNPCVDCNRYIKFGRLLEKARGLGKSRLVTGHYARIERGGDGRYLLKKGADTAKDQSYVLYALTQEQLSSVHLPLGKLSKPEVRELARGLGLNNAEKRESQDICFVPDGDYAGFISKYTGVSPRKGRFVDIEGNYLGEHDGVIRYTVGQRRGMGLAMPYPAYVLEIRPKSDTIVVGKNEMLFSKTLLARDINLIPLERIDAPLRVRAKIRYAQTEQPATVLQIDEDTLRIEFDEPQRAITKGQAAVVYDGEDVIGGGTIVSDERGASGR